MISILVVDDHQVFSESLVDTLSNEPEYNLLPPAFNGEDALKKIELFSIDVILLDLSLPDIFGVEIAKSAKKSKPDIKIIVLSTHDDINTIETALEAGVDGYVLKTSGRKEIIRGITAVTEKNITYIGPLVQRELSKQYYNEGVSGKSITLTSRERTIIALICKQKSTKEIAEELFITTSTVETHRKNIMLKIGAKNMVGIVLFAINNNIIDSNSLLD